jgi:hypothetical protein
MVCALGAHTEIPTLSEPALLVGRSFSVFSNQEWTTEQRYSLTPNLSYKSEFYQKRKTFILFHTVTDL